MFLAWLGSRKMMSSFFSDQLELEIHFLILENDFLRLENDFLILENEFLFLILENRH